MQTVVPRPDVAPLLQEHFVAYAADADDPPPEVIDLARQLKDAMMLPFVLFTDSDGQFLCGSSGLVDPGAFAATLQSLIQ